MTPRSAVGLAIASAVMLPASAAVGGTNPGLETVRIVGGLNRPVFVTHAPGDKDRLFIVEQRGVIRIFDLVGGALLPTAFLNIDLLVTNISGNDERGFLGLAFHPDYGANGLFYVDYTGTTGTPASSDTL